MDTKTGWNGVDDVGACSWVEVLQAVSIVVLVYYAWQTRNMVVEQRHANNIAKLREQWQRSSQLYVSLDNVVLMLDKPELNIAVENAGPAVAENVMVFPILAFAEKAEAPRRKMVENASECEEHIGQKNIGPRYRECLGPRQRASVSWGHLIGKGDVICLAWDDQARGRQIHCYSIDYEENDTDGTYFLVSIDRPCQLLFASKTWAYLCPAYRKLDNKCPHEWRRKRPKEYEQAMLKTYFRAPW